MTCIGTLEFRVDRTADVMMRTNGTLSYYYNDNHGYTTYYKCLEDFLEDYFIEDAIPILNKILELRTIYTNEQKTIQSTLRLNVYDGAD